jgi:hypothetical protein
MRKEFPTLWILQFLVLLIMGTLSLFFPDFILQYSRGMQPPVELEKPRDDLHDWVLGLKTVAAPDDAVKKFFLRMARKESTNDDHPEDFEESRYDGFWAKNAAGSTEANETDAEWKAVKKWLLACGPPLFEEGSNSKKSQTDQHSLASNQAEAKAAWARVTEWIEAVDEFPDPSPSLLNWIADYEEEDPNDEAEGPLSDVRHLILEARPTQAISWSISADYVRQSAPSILGAALFTLFGLLSGSIRRPLARIFVLVFLFWTIGIQWGRIDGELFAERVGLYVGLLMGVTLLGTLLKQCPTKSSGWTIWIMLTVWWARIGVLEGWNDYLEFKTTDASIFLPSCLTVSIVTVGFLGILNAYYWLMGDNEDPPQDDAGIAQGRPPQLWTIWMAQFVILAIVGMFTLLQPHVAAKFFTAAATDHFNTDIVDHSVRMLGVWVLALALFSYFAMGSARDWIWQGIAWIFMTVFVTFAASAALNLNLTNYTVWAYFYGFQGLLFVPMTWKQLCHKDPWSTENIESDVYDWQWGDLTIGLPMMLRPLLVGRRTLYRQGVGAGGVFRTKPLTEADFSEPALKDVVTNEFFSQKKEFPVQLRFSNRTQADDTSLDIRGCGIRLSINEDSPLDMLFATGSFAPIRSLKDAWHILPVGKFEERIANSKTLREGLVAGLRRAPKSFTCLTYYNQLVLEWRVPDGNHYLVRFRLLPTSDHAVSDQDKGVTDFEDLKSLWDQTRRAGEPRSRDYLRQRLYDRLTDGDPVTYELQAQFHAPTREDSLEWYDASLEWDERTHPWHSLGELVLNRLLSAAESDGLRFDPRNSPPSLRPPRGSSVSDLSDPRSLATAQYRVNSILGRIRLWRRPSQGQLHTAGAEPTSQASASSENDS